MKRLSLPAVIIGGIAGVALIAIVVVVVVQSITKNNGTGIIPFSNKNTSGPCTEIAVDIEGYGDQGKRLKNCFVEYPGEPTREDKSYYILEDVCGQFTKEFIKYVSGKEIFQTKEPTISGLFNCRYFLTEKTDMEGDHILIVFDYLSFENQKKGNEEMGRTVISDSRISMPNHVVYQEDGLINSIILRLSEKKIISLDRSSTTAMSNDEMLNMAIKLSAEIKNYK